MSTPYSRDDLAVVAFFYRLAFYLGRDPAKEVARSLRVPRSTARRWVMRCREVGLLSPTMQRKKAA